MVNPDITMIRINHDNDFEYYNSISTVLFLSQQKK